MLEHMLEELLDLEVAPEAPLPLADAEDLPVQVQGKKRKVDTKKRMMWKVGGECFEGLAISYCAPFSRSLGLSCPPLTSCEAEGESLLTVEWFFLLFRPSLSLAA